MTSSSSQGRVGGNGGKTGPEKFSRYNRVMGTWAIVGARVAGTLAFLALLGAWGASVRGGAFLGLTERHLFDDAIVLALFSIAGMLDGIVHRQAM